MTRSLRFGSIVLMSLGGLALCTAGWAQPGPGGPRPGGPGFGMFGGGPGGGSLSMMYGFLLNAPTVQKELELVDDQKAKIKEAQDKAQDRYDPHVLGIGLGHEINHPSPRGTQDRRHAGPEYAGREFKAHQQQGRHQEKRKYHVERDHGRHYKPGSCTQR